MRSEVRRRLGTRRVVWAGLRTDDIRGAAAEIPQLEAAYSIMGGDRRWIAGVDYERYSGVRVDADRWDIDDHLEASATRRFRSDLLQALDGSTALLPYRPTRFLSAIQFARSDSCLDLGMFAGHQAAFEHKPWVERGMASIGMPQVAWRYVADEDRDVLFSRLRSESLVLRRSRSSGGEGFTRVDDPSQLAARWPRTRDEFVSVAAYLRDAVPINIGGVVWESEVTVDLASVQLIGVAGCTKREFGYCGNDFAALADLPLTTLKALESSTGAVGRWLRSKGYLGAFGVDFLIDRGVPLFVEVNARFQGSTHAAVTLSLEAGVDSIVLQHVAALLGIDPPRVPGLAERLPATDPLAHVVVHNVGNETATFDGTSLQGRVRDIDPSIEFDMAVPDDVVVETGGVMARMTTRRRLTATGFDIPTEWREALTRARTGTASAEVPA